MSLTRASGDALGSIDKLHEAAVASTGLDDFGTDDHLDAMTVLLDSYLADAGLTELGVRRVRAQLGAALQARLRTEDLWRRHPEHGEVDLRRPVFVTGLPRTGTTALHRLLCADSRHQGLEMWLADAPGPRPPRDTWADHSAYAATQRDLDSRHAVSPGLNGVHYMAADVVEECWRLERQTMRTVMFESVARIPAYSRWLAAEDLTEVYRRHRRTLQLIGLHDSDRRWVLKNPGHLFGLDALMAAYPDALVVQTHRDPRTVVASVSSLTAQASAGTSSTFVGEAIGRSSLDLWARGAERFDEARQRYDQAQFIDVQYDDFVRDPLAAVQTVYDRLGVELDAVTLRTVEATHAESTTSEARPAHRYSLADFGLTEAEVLDRFADHRTEAVSTRDAR